MAWLDFLKKKEPSEKDSQSDSGGQKPVSSGAKKPVLKSAEAEPEGKYSQECSLCGKAGTDKKWAGQYWHSKCYRQGRKMAKRMV